MNEIQFEIQSNIIPILGMLTGIIIPLSVFIWLYYENKGRVTNEKIWCIRSC